MNTYQGKRVLITGASSGIGECFAWAFAAQGADLILVARSEQKLQSLAAELSRQHAIHVSVIPIDLTQPRAAETLYQRTAAENLTVNVLVNNAGFASHGYFEQVDLKRQVDEITLNISAIVELTHWFLPGMLERDSGTIINVSSTAAFQPVPYMAVYAATKAFVLNFSQALSEENRSRGVHVMALCPGATETAFFETVGAQEASVGTRATPEAVVKAALEALDQRRSFVIEGRMNNLLAVLPRFVPRPLAARIAGNAVKPRTA
jgi:uncharacterized protein